MNNNQEADAPIPTLSEPAIAKLRWLKQNVMPPAQDSPELQELVKASCVRVVRKLFGTTSTEYEIEMLPLGNAVLCANPAGGYKFVDEIMPR